MADPRRALATLALFGLLLLPSPAQAHDSDEGVHPERVAVAAVLVTGVAVWAWYHFIHLRRADREQAPDEPPPPSETPS